MSLAEQVIPNFKQDLQEIGELQRTFDSSLRRGSSRGILSYNPVLERWKYEQIVSETDEISFRYYEEKQIETVLRERLKTAKSYVCYKIEADKAYNERFPNEPFDTILRRGIEYRKEVGSTETEREQAELNGWENVFKNLLNPKTPEGSKFVVISGPGLVENTSYPHNFVDIYKKVKTPQGKITIQMTRTASQMDYGKYHEMALSFNPKYFKGLVGPIDAWHLSHPIPTDREPDIEIPYDTMEEETFEEIFKICIPLILNYINVLCQDKFDPKEIKIAFNAILNRADFEKRIIYQRRNGIPVPVRSLPVFKNTREEAYFLGTRPVEEISGGCGPSVGFATTDSLDNSVAQFGVGLEDDGLGPRTFPCPACKCINTRPFGGYVNTCQNPECPNPSAVRC